MPLLYSISEHQYRKLTTDVKIKASIKPIIAPRHPLAKAKIGTVITHKIPKQIKNSTIIITSFLFVWG
jgi:hypothetical protein